MIYTVCMTQELENKLKTEVIYPITKEINSLLLDLYNKMLTVAPELKEKERASKLEALLLNETTYDLVEKIKNLIW